MRPSPEIPLPKDLDAERFLLAYVLQNPEHYPEIAKRIGLDDFSMRQHSRIFMRMGDLYVRQLPIDTVTLYKELAHHHEAGQDGLGYLHSLEEGMPQLLDADGYIRILREKGKLREVIKSCLRSITSASTANGNAPEVLGQFKNLLVRFVEEQTDESGTRIRSLDELGCLEDQSQELEYLDYPLLPKGTLVAVSGNSGHGKSTFVTAVARDLTAAGALCIYLDRENPVQLVAKRYRELGISRANDNHPRHWGLWAKEIPPEPDDPRLMDLIRAAERDVLVIIDSKTSYLPGSNENDSAPNSAFFAKCRRLTAAGATVAVLINSSDKGESDYRGHSSIKDLIDSAFRVSNFDPDGAGLLHTLTIKPWKTRAGDWNETKVHYADGRLIRTTSRLEVIKTVTEQLRAILAANPGVGKREFYDFAVNEKLGERAARNFVEVGISEGSIKEGMAGLARHDLVAPSNQRRNVSTR
jgi:hypothetical protein